jgi:hypothetical protein
MTMNRNVDKIHTTIGELVVALSDAAFELCAKKRDAYFLVALAFKHLLKRRQRDEAADIANPASSCIYSLARGRPLSRSSSNPSLAQAYRPTRQKESPHYWNATKRSPQRNCGVSRCMTWIRSHSLLYCGDDDAGLVHAGGPEAPVRLGV